ncbi:ABC transporter permease [Tabrizicola sp.]|uniref:ABC transporter permease n=1 Tax=Tabrizicola sp. TaxID=2005166 RepID=UPI002FDE372C
MAQRLSPAGDAMANSSVGVALAAPLALFLFIALVLPMLGILAFSFIGGETPTANYGAVLTTPVFLMVIARTLLLGLIVAIVTTLLAFLFSLWVLRLSAKVKVIVVAAIVMPFFISYLLRALSWIPVLGFNGLLNNLLMAAGLTEAPLSLIYNPFAVVLGTSNALFPMACLPLLAAFHKVDQRLIQAAHSLGATSFTAFRQVFLPLVMPATLSTAVMIFAVATGFYITPSILGGGRVLLAPNLIELLIHRRGEWGTGAALTVILLVVFMASILLARSLSSTRFGRKSA